MAARMKEDLTRPFGLPTATFAVVSSMVGTGILISPGFMMMAMPNLWANLGLWALGGVLAFVGALCYAELGAAMPEAGGDYVYLREAYGPLPAFLSGWVSLLLGFSAPIAVVAYTSSEYLLSPLVEGPIGATPEGATKGLAAVLIVALTLPHLLGHRSSSWTLNFTTILKIGLLVLLVLGGILSGRGSHSHLTSAVAASEVEMSVVAPQLFYVLFAYIGWNGSAYLAGEIRDPEKNLPRSLFLGTLGVTALYIALSWVFMFAVPFKTVSFDNATQVPLMAATTFFGEGISNVFAVAVAITLFATLNAFILTGPRIYYAMAKNGLFPSLAGRLHPKTGVPVAATLSQSFLALVLLYVAPFQELYQYSALGLSLFSSLAIGAVYALRIRRPGLVRPFRVPGYPWTPAIYLLVTFFMAGYAVLEWTRPSLFALASLVVGVAVYFAGRGRFLGQPSGGEERTT
jgi:APA family basic amino acid/polyamine antiporter